MVAITSPNEMPEQIGKTIGYGLADHFVFARQVGLTARDGLRVRVRVAVLYACRQGRHSWLRRDLSHPFHLDTLTVTSTRD